MNSAQCITKRHKCSKVAADCAAEHGIAHGYTHCPCQVPTGISILHTSATDPAPMNSSCHSRPNATSVAKWPAIVPLTEHPHEQFAVDHDLVELLPQGRVWGCSVVSYLHLTYFVTLHVPVNSAGYGWRLGDIGHAPEGIARYAPCPSGWSVRHVAHQANARCSARDCHGTGGRYAQQVRR